jgi:hypothetical protein
MSEGTSTINERRNLAETGFTEELNYLEKFGDFLEFQFYFILTMLEASRCVSEI